MSGIGIEIMDDDNEKRIDSERIFLILLGFWRIVHSVAGIPYLLLELGTAVCDFCLGMMIRKYMYI